MRCRFHSLPSQCLCMIHTCLLPIAGDQTATFCIFNLLLMLACRSFAQNKTLSRMYDIMVTPLHSNMNKTDSCFTNRSLSHIFPTSSRITSAWTSTKTRKTNAVSQVDPESSLLSHSKHRRMLLIGCFKGHTDQLVYWWLYIYILYKYFYIINP